MNDTDRKQLESLRSKILTDIVPLVENSAIEPTQKFALMLSAARVSGDAKSITAAYDAAGAIEAPEDKADAMFELLEEIDFQLGDVETTEETQPEQQEAAPATEEMPTEAEPVPDEQEPAPEEPEEGQKIEINKE